MYSRSSTSSFRRSLALGALTFALVWGAVEAAGLPRVAFYGGRKLADKFVRLEELERSGPVDVFVVGPSHIDQGFDAGRFGEVTGTRAFNMGVQGTDMYFQSILLRDVLLRPGPFGGRAPKAVLWSLRDEVLTRSNINRQYVQSTVVSYATGPLGAWALELGPYLTQFHRRRLLDWFRELSSSLRASVSAPEVGAKAAELRTWLEPLDAFGKTELSTLTRQERQATQDREDRDDEGGGDGAGAGGAPGTTRFMGQDYAVDLATAKAHVRETLRLLRARGIAVWFFFTPYFESVFARNSRQSEMLLLGENQPYYDWLTELAREFRSPLVDLHYCAGISGDPRFFFDTRHLTGPGSVPLGELVGELYSGKRPLPAAWSGAPAPAVFDCMFGKLERERVPRLALGERHALDAALGMRNDGRLLDLYASFAIERAGKYRVSLLADPPPAKEPALFVRFGDGHHRRFAPRAEPRRTAVVLEVELEPGERLLEIHAVEPKQPLVWSQLVVEPIH